MISSWLEIKAIKISENVNREISKETNLETS